MESNEPDAFEEDRLLAEYCEHRFDHLIAVQNLLRRELQADVTARRDNALGGRGQAAAHAGESAWDFNPQT